MTTIAIGDLDLKKGMISSMRRTRQPWWLIWRDIADYYMPKRLVWLQSPAERAQRNLTNSNIIDNTGTLAGRTLAAGLMNGIASPSRPWFKLRLVDFSDDISQASRVWLDEVERRMRYAIAESNFYNALAQFFIDLSFFSTGAMTIYDDPDHVFYCRNHALGEFYIDLDHKMQVCNFGLEFKYTVQQLVQWFGIENCSTRVKEAHKAGGAQLFYLIDVQYLVEPNDDGRGGVPKTFEYRETYWESSNDTPGMILSEKGYDEKPNIVARWEVTGNEPYGTGPGLDTIGDVKQLQHETKKKAQGMDMMVQPPLLVDVQLENRPIALLPRGITYVPRLDATNGAKPIFTVNLPLGEMTQDILSIQSRIKDGFYNFLFNKVTNLSTVRSAREIDAIEGEKLVLLGAVLERFENEALDPAINRIFAIMTRKKMFPPAPPEIQNANLQIQYVSLIASAQSAAGTAATERFLQFSGNLIPVWPEAKEVPEITGMLTDYGKDLGIPQKNIRTKDQIAAIVDAANQQAQQMQGMQQATDLSKAGKNLAATDVGGGQNLLQRMLSGAQQ